MSEQPEATVLCDETKSRWLIGSDDHVVALQRPYPANRMAARGPVFRTRGDL